MFVTQGILYSLILFEDEGIKSHTILELPIHCSFAFNFRRESDKCAIHLTCVVYLLVLCNTDFGTDGSFSFMVKTADFVVLVIFLLYLDDTEGWSFMSVSNWKHKLMLKDP